MGIKYQRGFTIIETLLFLGITGLLVFAVLAGTGTAVNQQRYRDSVNSFVTLFQDQYANVSAVHNDRVADWTCSDAAGLASTPSTDAGTPRGASDCAIIGQIIRTTDGEHVTIDSVIGRHVDTALQDDSASDKDTLLAMDIQALGSADPSHITTQQLEWGATLGRIGGGSAAFSTLIVRSPTSGTIRTFIDPTSGTTKLTDLVSDDNLKRGLELCVDSAGLFSSTGTVVVEVLPGSANASGVRIQGTGSKC